MVIGSSVCGLCHRGTSTIKTMGAGVPAVAQWVKNLTAAAEVAVKVWV